MADKIPGTSQSPAELWNAIKSYASGMAKGNTSDTLGAPVDIINSIVRPITERLGLYNDDPVGGGKFFRRLMGQSVEDTNPGETAGSMISIGGLAKAMIIGAARAEKIGAADYEKAKETFERVPMANIDQSELFQRTGVYVDQGKDKAVISDRDAMIRNGMLALARKGEVAVTLDRILDHPRLFEAYPELRSTLVGPETNPRNLASFSPQTRYIGMGEMNKEYTLSVLLHEVQHNIQEIEDFRRGGSSEQFLPKNLPKIEEKLARKIEHSDPNIRKTAMRYAEQIDRMKKQANVRYENIPGEQEARFTQNYSLYPDFDLREKITDTLRSGKTPSNMYTQPVPSVIRIKETE